MRSFFFSPLTAVLIMVVYSSLHSNIAVGTANPSYSIISHQRSRSTHREAKRSSSLAAAATKYKASKDRSDEGINLISSTSASGTKRGSRGQAKSEYDVSIPLRVFSFWRQAMQIYASYKLLGAKVGVISAARRSIRLFGPMKKGTDEASFKEYVEKLWTTEHERNSDRMLALCLDLRGFYLKAGQMMGTRADFMPKPYLTKLSQLHDRVPQIPTRDIQRVIEGELNRERGKVAIDEVFDGLDLDKPIGCASICQVYKARWRDTNEDCAVKIQYPGAESIMRSDLSCLTSLARFLQRRELRFDLLSVVKELQVQIHREFDFRLEAESLRTIGKSLAAQVSSIKTPVPIFVTKKLLVMSFLPGVSMTRLRDTNPNLPAYLRRKAGKKILDQMAEAWGYMLFKDKSGEFHADPHPGNILIEPKTLQLGIIDFGQTKKLSDDMRRKFAEMVIALSEKNRPNIVKSFKVLGMVLEDKSAEDVIERVSLSMFDTAKINGRHISPFDEDFELKKNAIKSFPQSLAYLLRTIQIFRGIACNMDVEFSVCDSWVKDAKAYVNK